jgi:cytochrome c-type biogenesis protein CcmF
VLFAVFAFVVLLGTVFPLVVEALNGDRLTVGVPYFNRMTMPIGFALLTLMAIAPVLPWRKASGELLRDRLWWPAWGGVAAVVLGALAGADGVAPLIAFGLGGFAAGSALRQLVLATRRQGVRGLVGRDNGGMVVHLGTIMIAVALAASQSFIRTAEFDLKPGATAVIAGHTVKYLDSRSVEKSNRVELRAKFLVDGKKVFEPRLNKYRLTGQTIGTPSVKVGPREDVYLALTRAPGTSNPAVGLRVIVQPLVVWLWVGGMIMVLGTVLALFPGRRRNPLDPVSAPAAPEVEGDGPPSDGSDESDGEVVPA